MTEPPRDDSEAPTGERSGPPQMGMEPVTPRAPDGSAPEEVPSDLFERLDVAPGGTQPAAPSAHAAGSTRRPL